MAWAHRLVRTLFGSKAVQDFEDEAESHRLLQIEDNLARGLTPDAARLEAQRRLGNLLLARERTHDADTLPWLRDLVQDVGYAARTLRQRPTFAMTAIAAIALGIGATVAVFSVVNAVLLRPLPYPDPHRLVTLGYTFQATWVPLVSPAKFVVWQREARVFDHLAAFRRHDVGLRVDGVTEPLTAMRVSAPFFALLGARPVAGRTFSPEDDGPDAALTVVLSHRLWTRRFGGEGGVVGRTVDVDRQPATVVGVLEPMFDVTAFGVEPDVWLPLQLDPHTTDHPPSLWAVGRLAPTVSLETANAQARLLGDSFHRLFPDASGPTDTFQVAPLEEVIEGRARQPLAVLMGAVTLVLLIACANVATLLLVRTSARQREMALRAAIGAGRGRLVRQLWTESVLLSGIGGLVGLGVGLLGMRALVAVGPVDLPRLSAQAAAVSLDWRVVTWTLMASVVTGMLFGLAPILHIVRLDLRASLSGASGGSPVPWRAATIRQLLVIAQIAIALVLLVGALLLVRTLIALRTVDRGYDARQVLTLRVLRAETSLVPAATLQRQVTSGTAHLRAVPDVMAAAATCCLPLESDWLTSFTIAGQRRTSTRDVSLISYRIVSPEYFEALGIPVRRGRAFTGRDVAGSPRVALINQAMARRYWADADPLSDRVHVFPGLQPEDDDPRQIVGIVGDALDGLLLTATERPTVYVPLAQLRDDQSVGWPLTWIIRTRGLTPGLITSVRTALGRASDGQPLTQVLSLDDWMRTAESPARFNTVALTSFAMAALLLAAVGVFAVLAYTVSQRTPELGVRVALGATRHQIRRLVLADGVRLLVIGVLLGEIGAAGLSRWLTASLFRVDPYDASVFLGAPLLLAVAGLLAAWVPVRRAAHVEPMTWLRSE